MELTKRITVNQPIEKLWQILAVEFAAIGNWTTTVALSPPHSTAASLRDGTAAEGRVCSVAGLGEITETITRYDERNKVLSYTAEASGMLSPANGLTNTWSLRAITPDATEVTTRVEGNMSGVMTLITPLLKVQIHRLGDRLLQELKYYAETGTIHPQKRKALRKAKRGAVTT